MPGLAPAGDLLFFASPKKPKEKKGDPQSGSLRYATGNLRCARKAGVRANSLHCVALKQRAALIPIFWRSTGPARTGLGGSQKTKNYTDASLPPPLGEGWGGG